MGAGLLICINLISFLRVEFVESYFAQQMEVEDRIHELTVMIEEDMKKKTEIQSKLKEIEGTERINQFGIMDESQLTATVVEARELGQGNLGAPSPYVMMEIEG